MKAVTLLKSMDGEVRRILLSALFMYIYWIAFIIWAVIKNDFQAYGAAIFVVFGLPILLFPQLVICFSIRPAKSYSRSVFTIIFACLMILYICIAWFSVFFFLSFNAFFRFSAT